MTTVALPDGTEVEASFVFVWEYSDNGMSGPHFQFWFEAIATMDLLEVYLPDDTVESLTREAAVARYGDEWVCRMETLAEEAEE